MIEANIRGIINEFLHDSILEIMKISLIVLIVGGAEILIIIKMNHQNLILGEMERIPLNKIVFREWIFKYKSFARRKRAEDDIPWAIIIIVAPIKPNELSVRSLINVNPICATDEYAIRAFISFWRIQFILV